MLTIRAKQMDVFKESALRTFKDEMAVHCRAFSPRLCEVIGEEQLRVAIDLAMLLAGKHKFTNRGPIRLYLELMFLIGSSFDTDPQYPWAAQILGGEGDQMERAEKLSAAVNDYQEKLADEDGANTRRAMEELLTLARKPTTLTSEDFLARMPGELQRVFPQKAAIVGEQRLRLLVLESRAEAAKYRMAGPRAEVLLASLMFACGHGCASDPLFPWIEQTLKDARIADGAARAERLEKKAVTWAEHVLSGQTEAFP